MRRGLGAAASLAWFFALAFGWSWSWWLAAAAVDDEAARYALLYTGIPGPLVAALLLLYADASAGTRRRFFRSIYEVRRLRPGWWVFVLLLYPALTGVAAGIDSLLTGTAPDTRALAVWLHDPSLLLSTLLLVMLLGPLPEEPGWRGFALQRMIVCVGPLPASLLLGLIWAIWHLPLFFVSGTYQHDLGIGSARHGIFMLTAVFASVIMTAAWKVNGRSVLAAVLVHALINATHAAMQLGDLGEVLRMAMLSIVGLLVVVCYRESVFSLPGALGATRRGSIE